jgi:phenylalanyl-tRNA synthetase alpha chain
MGFTEIRGDYIESCFWNMDALFIPQDHPARDAQDTFYLKNPTSLDIPAELAEKVKRIHETGGDTGSEGWKYKWSDTEARRAILRTHTTVNTIRYLSEHPEPPVKVFSVGKVFRREATDPKHLAEFHQIEGIVMEEGANFRMLIGVIKEFYSRMGFSQVRFRPSFFPYTEPSLEVEVLFGDRWMELGGAGIFRPEVTAPFNIKHPVLAWGLGLERLVMKRYGIADIRQLYMGDLEWMRKTPII